MSKKARMAAHRIYQKEMTSHRGRLEIDEEDVVADFYYPGIDLQRVYFSRARFNGMEMNKAVLKNSVFYDCALDHSPFRGTSFERVDIRRSSAKRARFDNCDFADAILENVDLERAVFISCDFSGAALSRCDLEGVVFMNCNFKDAIFSDCSLINHSATESIFLNAEISNCDMSGLRVIRCDLRGLKLVPKQGTLCPDTTFKIKHGKNLYLEVIGKAIKPDALMMHKWHECDTVHCLAGWAIHLSGVAGYALEEATSPSVAGAMLCPELAHLFYEDTDAVLEEIILIAKEAEVKNAG